MCFYCKNVWHCVIHACLNQHVCVFVFQTCQYYGLFFNVTSKISLTLVAGCSEPLLVKFADSGNKKKSQQQKMFQIGREDVSKNNKDKEKKLVCVCDLRCDACYWSDTHLRVMSFSGTWYVRQLVTDFNVLLWNESKITAVVHNLHMIWNDFYRYCLLIYIYRFWFWFRCLGEEIRGGST